MFPHAPIRRKLSSSKPLVAITAYDYTTAVSARRAGGIDVVFVLASEVAHCSLGLPSAASLSLDDMVRHTRAVARGISTPGSSPDPLVIAELPCGTYEFSAEQAQNSALMLVKAQPPAADGVLLCGGKELAVQFGQLSEAGILAVARLGMPSVARKLQTMFVLGDGVDEEEVGVGVRVVGVGRTLESARELLTDAQALDCAGAAAVVLEGVAMAAAAKVESVLTAPVLGMGCGMGCAGQLVAVSEILGMRVGERVWARWHKKYGNAADQAVSAISKYVAEVNEGTFPGKELSCDMKEGEDAQFRQIMAPSRRRGSFLE